MKGDYMEVGESKLENDHRLAEVVFSPPWFSFRLYLFIFRERGRKKGRMREKTSMCGCLSYSPYWELSLKPRHVPRLGIKPEAL